MNDRRLIEDYLPLGDLNAVASKEKLHPRRYVELVHYWPARRPITASRAAIYATLVAAPASDEQRGEAASFVKRLAAFKAGFGHRRRGRHANQGCARRARAEGAGPVRRRRRHSA